MGRFESTTSQSLVNDVDAADYLGLSVHTLRRWRMFRNGPAFVKVGGKAVRYRIADLEAFIGRPAPEGKGA